MAEKKGTRRTAVRTYVIGYIYSLILTFTAYLLVTHHAAGNSVLIAAIFTLAVIQLMVQLVFFLHLGHEAKPYWNLIVLSFAVTTVVIVVFGSIWIMDHLDYNMRSPDQVDTQIIKDEGIKNY